jgi:hypothetical protein
MYQPWHSLFNVFLSFLLSLTLLIYVSILSVCIHSKSIYMVFLYVMCYCEFLFVYIHLRVLKFSFLPYLFFVCLVILHPCLATMFYLRLKQYLVYMITSFHSSILNVLYSFRLDIRVLLITLTYTNIYLKCLLPFSLTKFSSHTCSVGLLSSRVVFPIHKMNYYGEDKTMFLKCRGGFCPVYGHSTTQLYIASLLFSFLQCTLSALYQLLHCVISFYLNHC